MLRRTVFVLIALGIAATVVSQLDSHRAPEPALSFRWC
jgi:hypothetical protein